MPTRSSRAAACSTLSGVRSLPRRLGKRSRSTSRSSALCSARSASRRKHRGTSSESTATSSTSTASRRSSSKRKETDPEAASAKLHEALALWRGRPLEEFAYEGFAQVEIARLEELRLACLEERVDADLACGRHSELVGELEALVAEHPHRELLRGQLMLALYRSGRQAEALEAYQEARRVLVEGLGIEPGRSLRELEQAILRQDPSLDLVSASAETAEAADAPRGIFVGREPELEELRAGLDAAVAGRGRLFLLAGEPGIGKSRLADEVIRQARERRACVLVGRCWEAGGPPPTGRGCSRCACTSSRASRRLYARSSRQVPPMSLRSSRSCASSFPTCRSRHSRPRERASGSSTRRAAS